MAEITTIEELKEYINKHYDPSDVGGSYWDSGNYDDTFECGQDNGRTHTLFDIGKKIGMELTEPFMVD